MPADPPSASDREFQVGAAEAGERLDCFLVSRLPQYTRAAVRRLIDAGGVTVGGAKRKPSHALSAGAVVRVATIEPPRDIPEPEDIPLDVLEEDDAIAVVNKPAGMVVHPGRGHWSGTLAAALAHHFTTLSRTAGSTRPGIVHRLDRDTSGVLIVAKTDSAHEALAAQFRARSVEKEYLAIVVGRPDRDRDRIVGPIGVHPTQRNKMAIRGGHATSREAETFYEVSERFPGFAFVRVFPKTGRTHQIRLHLASIGCAVLCDRLYGGRARIAREELAKGSSFGGQGSGSSGDSRAVATPVERATNAAGPQVVLARHALHAHRLSFLHPTTGQRRECTAPLADDMQNVLDILRETRGGRPA